MTFETRICLVFVELRPLRVDAVFRHMFIVRLFKTNVKKMKTPVSNVEIVYKVNFAAKIQIAVIHQLLTKSKMVASYQSK